MNAAMPYDALQPRPPGGMVPGATLSVLVHAGLVAAIALGVSWQRTADVEFSAELWSALPEVAAPRAQAPAPTPSPTPPPAPTPAPAPAAPPQPSAADIALERERAAQKQREEREARLQREREAEAKRVKEAEAAALKRQRELQKAREEELARKAEEERIEKQRKENLQRLLAQAGGGQGAPGSTGTAARNAARSQSYVGILREHIKTKLFFDTSGLSRDIEAIVEVRATATGTVLSRRLIRSSGNDAYDNAILRAVEAASPLPRDKDGTVPGTLELSFKPGQ